MSCLKIDSAIVFQDKNTVGWLAIVNLCRTIEKKLNGYPLILSYTTLKTSTGPAAPSTPTYTHFGPFLRILNPTKLKGINSSSLLDAQGKQQKTLSPETLFRCNFFCVGLF